MQARLPSLAGLWGGVLMYFTLLQCRISQKHCQWLMTLIVLSATVEGGIVLLDMFAGGLPFSFTQDLLSINGRRAFGTFQQMNVTASFLATGLVVCLLLLVRPERITRSGRGDIVIALCLQVLSATLVLLQSRTGWAGAGAGYLLVCGLLWQQGYLSSGQRALLLLCPLPGVVVGIALLHLPGVPFVDHSESSFQRWLTLRATWNMIQMAPVQGWGAGSFGYTFQHWMAGMQGSNPGRELMLHPHNEILYQWMEGGLVALLGCLMVVAAGVSIIRNSRASRVQAGWVALLPVIIHTQTEFPLYYSAAHVLTLVLLLVCVDTGQTVTVRLRPQGYRFQAGKMVVFLVCAYFIGLLGQTLNDGFMLSRYESKVPGSVAQMQALPGVTWLLQSRYEYDKNTLLLAEFNISRDPALLRRFLSQNARWMQYRISPDAVYNQILVQKFLSRDEEGLRGFYEAGRLFPWDPRFGHRSP